MNWYIQHTYIQAHNPVVAYNTCTALCYSQFYNHNLEARSQAVSLPPFGPQEYPTQPQIAYYTQQSLFLVSLFTNNFYVDNIGNYYGHIVAHAINERLYSWKELIWFFGTIQFVYHTQKYIL